MSRREEIARQRTTLAKAEKKRQGWTDVIIETVLIIIAEAITFSFWHSPGDVGTIVSVTIAIAIIFLVPLRRKL